jgi:hypothetical protein
MGDLRQQIAEGLLYTHRRLNGNTSKVLEAAGNGAGCARRRRSFCPIQPKWNRAFLDRMILNNESCPGKPEQSELDNAAAWQSYTDKFVARCREVAERSYAGLQSFSGLHLAFATEGSDGHSTPTLEMAATAPQVIDRPSVHFSSRRGYPVRYIVVHSTDSPVGAPAVATLDYLAKNNRGVSVHELVLPIAWSMTGLRRTTANRPACAFLTTRRPNWQTRSVGNRDLSGAWPACRKAGRASGRDPCCSGIPAVGLGCAPSLGASGDRFHPADRSRWRRYGAVPARGGHNCGCLGKSLMLAKGSLKGGLVCYAARVSMSGMLTG